LEAKVDAIFEQIKMTNRLLALLLVADEENLTKKSLVLLDCGFKLKDVSEMLGSKIGTITKARSRVKGTTEH